MEKFVLIVRKAILGDGWFLAYNGLLLYSGLPRAYNSFAVSVTSPFTDISRQMSGKTIIKILFGKERDAAMLENLRILAQTYDQIHESEEGYKTPGHVEAGEESWERAVRSEGSPEEAVALAEQFIQVAQRLKQLAQDATRKGAACRIRSGEDFFE